MRLGKLMNKLNYYSFSKDELDIIEKYDEEEKSVMKYIVYSLISAIIINEIMDSVNNNIVSILSIILISIVALSNALCIYFLITKNKRLVKELKKSIGDKYYCR